MELNKNNTPLAKSGNKYEFGFNVTDIADFTNENTGLVASAVYSAPTIASGIDIIVGQKGAVKLNTVSHNLYLQSAACGWSVSGDTVLEDVDVSVCSVDYKEALCPKTLETKWYGQLMAQGSNPETFPFAQFIADTKMATLTAEVDRLFWQGDETFGSGNLALCTGIGSYLSGLTGDVYVDGATTATLSGFTSANINTAIQLLINNVDERAYTNGDLTLHMSVANFKLYVQYLITANLYNYAQNVNGKTLEVTIPGHDIRVMGLGGLRGTDYFYLTPSSNMALVTDSLSDGDLDMWYSKDNVEIRLLGSFKLGVGIYFPALFVHNNDDVQ